MEKLINDPDRVWHFLKDIGVPVMYSAGMQGIGREIDGGLVGAVLYEGYTTNNIFMHCAGRGKRWISKSLLKSAFAYPFKQLSCKRITAWVEDSNVDSKRLVEHIGFEVETMLKGAAHDGGDVILYVMWRDKCRFLKD
jgi:RimJ/RimL family protein N-acetyltransferase